MISSISLRGVLPEVFAGERRGSASAGEVWLGDVTFERGGIYLVEATSGAGKSSLCSFLYGNRRDYAGAIEFDGRDVRRFSIADWCRVRREDIALLPQEMRLFPELTAMENILVKNRLTRFKTDTGIREMLDRLGILHKADTPAGRLSIGQQQRVALVRTLCQPCSFILLDEPVSHLDADNNVIAAALVAEEAARQGAAIIATSVGNRISLPFTGTLRMT